jgi:hypothetical protein
MFLHTWSAGFSFRVEPLGFVFINIDLPEFSRHPAQVAAHNGEDFVLGDLRWSAMGMAWWCVSESHELEFSAVAKVYPSVWGYFGARVFLRPHRQS